MKYYPSKGFLWCGVLLLSVVLNATLVFAQAGNFGSFAPSDYLSLELGWQTTDPSTCGGCPLFQGARYCQTVDVSVPHATWGSGVEGINRDSKFWMEKKTICCPDIDQDGVPFCWNSQVDTFIAPASTNQIIRVPARSVVNDREQAIDGPDQLDLPVKPLMPREGDTWTNEQTLAPYKTPARPWKIREVIPDPKFSHATPDLILVEKAGVVIDFGGIVPLEKEVLLQIQQRDGVLEVTVPVAVPIYSHQKNISQVTFECSNMVGNGCTTSGLVPFVPFELGVSRPEQNPTYFLKGMHSASGTKLKVSSIYKGNIVTIPQGFTTCVPINHPEEKGDIGVIFTVADTLYSQSNWVDLLLNVGAHAAELGLPQSYSSETKSFANINPFPKIRDRFSFYMDLAPVPVGASSVAEFQKRLGWLDPSDLYGRANTLFGDCSRDNTFASIQILSLPYTEEATQTGENVVTGLAWPPSQALVIGATPPAGMPQSTISQTIMHELGHIFGLEEGYVRFDTSKLSSAELLDIQASIDARTAVFPHPANCQKNANFMFQGVPYGKAYEGCKTVSGLGFYRPSKSSFMGTTDEAAGFDIPSCATIFALIKTGDSSRYREFLDQCSTLYGVIKE